MPVLLQVNFTRNPAHAHATKTEAEKAEAAHRSPSTPDPAGRRGCACRHHWCIIMFQPADE